MPAVCCVARASSVSRSSPSARPQTTISATAQFTASNSVSQVSSSMRTRARSAADFGRIGGSGYASSRYSAMIVESNTRVSPSTSTGTSPRGLPFVKSESGARSATPGMRASNASPFSIKRILTFCAYGELGCS